MTIKELAKAMNLSVTTISRVLNGQAKKYRISRKTELEVRAYAERHGFSPNLVARNLRLQKTDTIGLVVPDISNPFFANLAKTLELELRKEGKLILLCDTHEDSSLEKESLRLLLDRKVDGLLVASVGLQSNHLADIKIPMVLIDRYFENLDIPYVSTNNFEGAYHATQHLLRHDHRSIACIQGLVETVPNQERVRGFQKAIQESGLLLKNCPVIGYDFSRTSGYTATKQLMLQTTKPTAIFSLGNQIAIGVIEALQEMGLRMPQDVSHISFDEQPYFQFTNPPLTTIQQPIQKIAEEAVNMLTDRMEGNTVSSMLLSPEMIQRGSVFNPNMR